MDIFDIVIIGAGPVGLYAGYYAGMRGLTVNIVENFEEAGGQPLNIYPEKHIYDVAGLPKVNGRELTTNLLAQLEQVAYELTLGARVERISREEERALFLVETSKGTLTARSVLLTTGHGLLKPRTLGLPEEVQLHQTGKLAYFVDNMESYRGQRVAVLGGGDSALDWALMLEELAAEVYLIHRREAFRAAEQTVERLQSSAVKTLVPYTVSALTEDCLSLQKVKAEETLNLEIDKILVNYGFVTEDTGIVPGLELTRNHRVVVTEGMHTNIVGLHAAGDACDYEGKVPLISVGFGEAVIAVNAITKTVNFDHKLRNGHSSSIFGG